MTTHATDTRLIEAGFPCHQVGAETQRERGASSSLPPLYYLHVWWARRPLTPSRAAILASLLSEDADPEWFLKELGIEKLVVEVGDQAWTLNPKDQTLLSRIVLDDGFEMLQVDSLVESRLEKEADRRQKNREIITQLIEADPQLAKHPVVQRWQEESQPIAKSFPINCKSLLVEHLAADPAHINERIAFAKSPRVREILGKTLMWDDEDLYGYSRAFTRHPTPATIPKVVLDPTAGGGSIPFEALRLGHRVIANELNPVAAVILHATLDYPARFGLDLAKDIQRWGNQLVGHVGKEMVDVTPFSPLPESERRVLKEHLKNYPELVAEFDVPEYHQTGLLYCRQVTCPHCGGKAPLLNSCWLSKEGQKWGVAVGPDEKTKDVRFETYRVTKGKGPNGEDPEFATVYRGNGTCIHCRQAIEGDEVKHQARGESDHGTWSDRLFCVVAVRYQPKLNKKGEVQRYSTGDRKGEIKTEKVTFFRPPNETDLAALKKAEARLKENWNQWEAAGLIPTEEIPPNSNYNRGHRMYGTMRWSDMFTPRQLLGHLTLIEALNNLKPKIVAEAGEDKARAIVTYLQFAIDKGLDYNSRHTRWEYTRGVIKGTFGRHDFSLKWTFGEMIFSGPSSGVAWGLSQVTDAFRALAELVAPLHNAESGLQVRICNNTAAHMACLEDETVDVICMDPPYYNNVQYAELSDYFYVWNKRTLGNLYPRLFSRRLTNKTDEATANPYHHGGKEGAKKTYEARMQEIFAECGRVLKDDEVMTLMFTHKEQDAWETLTRSLIESGWIITASFPVESETAHGTHTMTTASAASSIFITCRKRLGEDSQPATWTGFGGTGVQQRVAEAVAEALPEFERLKLNPVDEMVASYGRALRVLSERWPVLDGDEPVSPIRAMNEASRVVAERQITRITEGRLQVDDLNPEATMALTLYGIYGMNELPYDEALNLSRSLNIKLDSRTSGYNVEGRMVGINQDGQSRGSTSRDAESIGYFAPLLRKGSKLRLALPEERSPRRLENPQTEWDVLHGVIMSHRRGDVPVARAYLNQHADGRAQLVLDLLHVWAEEMADEKLRQEGQTILFGLK